MAEAPKIPDSVAEPRSGGSIFQKAVRLLHAYPAKGAKAMMGAAHGTEGPKIGAEAGAVSADQNEGAKADSKRRGSTGADPSRWAKTSGAYDTYTDLMRTDGSRRPVEIPGNLKRFVDIEPLDAETLDVPEAANRLKMSPEEVCDWIRGGELIGWVSANYGQTIPAEQILGPGKVVPGVKRLLEIIKDPELVWIFISEEWPFENEVVRPLDKLKAGEVDEVVGSALGFGSAFT